MDSRSESTLFTHHNTRPVPAPSRRNTMQTCHCLRRILFSVLLLCPASAGLPLLSVAQESYRTQMSFRKPFLTPSTASKETPSARPGHAKPFMGWRKAAQDGPATLQYFKNWLIPVTPSRFVLRSGV